MARIRTIKPELWTSLTINALSWPARLTFIGLWNYCDDEGRGKDDARLVKAAIWPLDERATARRVDVWLDEIAALGLILRYEAGAGSFLQVAGWTEHQRISHPTPSVFPPPSSVKVPETFRKSPETLRPEVEQGTGNREQGMEQGVAPASRPREPSVSPRPRDPVFDALCEACGMDVSELTAVEARKVGVARARLKGKPVTREMVLERAGAWPAVMGDATMTPNAITTNWARLNGNARASPRKVGSGMDLLAQSRRHREEEDREAERSGGDTGLPQRSLPPGA